MKGIPVPEDRVSVRYLDRLAFARDASLYRLVPEMIVRPGNEEDVRGLLRYCRESNSSVTFRTGGTSLSGQAVTEGIIAETVRDWKRVDVLEEGRLIQLQPGVVGSHANRALESYRRRIGPDPASINAAMIGGIVSNNASGMACGIKNNSYHTLKGIRFILANGGTYSTNDPEDYIRFLSAEEPLAEGLTQLRERILSHNDLRDKIRKKYRLKNTLGYSVNALIDFEHPLDIFAHLLVGSEGTLAFISQVTLETIPDLPFKTAGLMIFDSIKAACGSIPLLKDSGADAVELMDYPSLSTARYMKDPPYDLQSLTPASTALLCEFQSENGEELEKVGDKVVMEIVKMGGSIPGGFQTSEVQRQKLWNIRKGLYPTVGSLRKAGTSVITEDICYDVKDLPNVMEEMQSIFKTWKYDDAVIFGHAKDGNLHFVASIDLESKDGINRYEGMMQDLVGLTVERYDGSLKAEHGTGRNMAPFVETEWGGDLYEIMWKIKRLADPKNILNPGVLLSRDQTLHLKNLKPMPPINDHIDLCVECGFCESTCPSRELTLTPRQRIVIAREMQALTQKEIAQWDLDRDYRYFGDQTCAVDGLCQLACPVNIDTGSFVKDLRYRNHSRMAGWIANWTVNHFAGFTKLVRISAAVLRAKSAVFGPERLQKFLSWINRVSSRSIPVWGPAMPSIAPRVSRKEYGTGSPYIYYTSCINRVFSAAANGRETLADVLGDIATATGNQLIIPEELESTCCGTPYGSKGYIEQNNIMINKTLKVLYEASKQGEIPILVDTSPCTYQFQNTMNTASLADRALWGQLTFVDIVPFLLERVQDRNLTPLDRQVVLHPTCSTRKMGQEKDLEHLARICAAQVTIPPGVECCGFAGDRGLLVPELTRSSVRREVIELGNIPENTRGYSTSRMCEVGMTSVADFNYESIAFLVRDYLCQN